MADHTTTLERYPIDADTRAWINRPHFGHFIDGSEVPSLSGETFDVFDPSSGELVAHAAQAGPEDVDAAVSSARLAFDDRRWQDTPPLEKERVLRRLAGLIDANATLIGELDVIDAGFLKAYSGFITDFAIDGVEYFSGWPTKIEGGIAPMPVTDAVYTVREPIGVVGVIWPWNGPSAVIVSISAALAAGCSVVLKPAEQTPMSAVVIAGLAVEAGLPPGVLNVLQGAGAVAGAGLVSHPGVDKISFTGSVETGRAVGAAAAQLVKPVTLELGGKSAHIIFEDASLEAAADAAAMSVWANSGQVCVAGTRVLVQRSVHDTVVRRIADSSREIVVGGAFDPDSQMGPLISRQQLERVAGYVRLGQDEGADLVLGGRQTGAGGYFFEPTIFTNVQNSMRIAQEEIFGPVMSIIPFDTEEEALRIANGSQYGLAAGIWTNDMSRIHRAYRALRAGTVWVNTYKQFSIASPFGGDGASGIGREKGRQGLRAWQSQKSVYVDLTGEPHPWAAMTVAGT